MNTTRKLPHSMTKDGGASQGGEHLIPCLEMPRRNIFVGVKTGKVHDKGYLVFLGKDVGADDIFNKSGMTETRTETDRKAMESFLQALQALKIGNVVSVVFTAEDSCTLKKEAEHPANDQRKNILPE
jgi:hypothetical protein